MVHLPRFSQKQSSCNGDRVSAKTAGIVKDILEKQLPAMMKTLSPRKLTGFNEGDDFVLPRVDHLKQANYDQYRVRQRDRVPADNGGVKNRAYKSPEYICFINRNSENIAEGTRDSLPSWRQRKRKAPPPRVKSMDELLLEESLRRNARTQMNVPDLRIKGSFAPGYQCKWERLKHLPDIKPVNQGYERQPESADRSNLYQDADASFSQTRVDEILKSEGFFSPDSGIVDQPASTTDTSSTSSKAAVSHIMLDDDFFKGNMLTGQHLNCSPRENPRNLIRLDQSRLSTHSKGLPQSKESLAILHSRKKLPKVTNHSAVTVKPD